MRDSYRYFRFAFIMPAAQLLFCFVTLWPVRGMIVGGVRTAIRANRHERAYSRPDPIYLSNLRLAQLLGAESRSARITEQLIWIPALLNLPSSLAEIPQAILSPTHMSWSPNGMDFHVWRAISWPLIGIVFWWIAGRAIDALVAAQHRITSPGIGWTETAMATLALACGVIFCMLPFMVKFENDRFSPLWPLVCAAGAMWALLGSATIVAHLVQWRIRRGNSDKPAPLTGAIRPDSRQQSKNAALSKPISS